MERSRLDTLADSPLDGPLEYVRAVVVHPEDEAPVDHDAEAVQTANRGVVVPSDVLELALLGEIRGVDRLESHEQASQPGRDCFLQELRAF